MKQPIASTVHPRALEKNLPDQTLKVLSDQFLCATPPSSELVDLVVEAVPGADKHTAVRDEFKREQRMSMQMGRGQKTG